ncbi:hypothetical protein [Rhodospirillum sp. A1_3_36]
MKSRGKPLKARTDDSQINRLIALYRLVERSMTRGRIPHGL